MSAESSDGHDVARRIANALLEVPGVRAVALGGSRASGLAGAGSDIDLYAFAAAEGAVSLTARASLARELADPAAAIEIGNDTWGPGDEWTEASSGLGVDLMYWTCGGSRTSSTASWSGTRPRSATRPRGGTTSAAHCPSVSTATGTASCVGAPSSPTRSRCAGRSSRNHPILRHTRSSLAQQIDSALARADAPAVLDRTAALLVSYFDVLFAANRVPHPGQKRLVAWVERTCARAPADLGERLEVVRAAAGAPRPAAAGRHPLPTVLHGLIDDLDEILADDGLLP